MRVRSRRRVVAATKLLWMVGTGGCWGHQSDDCELLLTCTQYDRGQQDGGVPVRCVPQEGGEPVADACGVFVTASGDEAGSGAKQTPVKTLAKAVALAEENGTRRVYACAEEFEEALEVAGGVTIYGALDCANGWRWVGETKKTTLTAAQGTIPLRMRAGDGTATVRIEDVLVRARSIDVSDWAARGTSSIAALTDNVDVELVRCVLEAGDAAPGVAGEGYTMRAMAGADGNKGNDACSANQVFGGDDKVNTCGTPEDHGDDSIGGSGGWTSPCSGVAGNDGSPGDANNAGAGESTSLCSNGTAGSDGIAGDAGAGATGIGLISASGYMSVAGLNGTRGTVAQGGGSKGGTGGSSIALISLNATLSFDNVTLKTGRGAAAAPAWTWSTTARPGPKRRCSSSEQARAHTPSMMT